MPHLCLPLHSSPSIQALEPSLKESLGYVLSRYPQSGLWVTGHSLGGALAMLAVADLKGNHSVHVEAVYTFGTSREET